MEDLAERRQIEKGIRWKEVDTQNNLDSKEGARSQRASLPINHNWLQMYELAGD